MRNSTQPGSMFSEIYLNYCKTYRAGPLMIAIIFMIGTNMIAMFNKKGNQYDCNDSYYGDPIEMQS